MLGAMGRERGAYDLWISIVGTIGGLAIVLVARSLRGAAPNLPAPLDRGWPFIDNPLCAIALTISMRGLDRTSRSAGCSRRRTCSAWGSRLPHIGAALFLGAATAGTLFGSAVYDHLGAFGSKRRRYTAGAGGHLRDLPGRRHGAGRA
jgi:hypothetical protein